jgi:hypothetical protein
MARSPPQISFQTRIVQVHYQGDMVRRRWYPADLFRALQSETGLKLPRRELINLPPPGRPV